MKRHLYTLCCILAAFVLVFSLAGCKSESDKVKEALRPALESYAHATEDDKKGEVTDPDYGDSETASVLTAYGVDMNKLHELCFARFSYELGDASVSDDGMSATVPAKITNVSLASAAKNASSDYASYANSDEAASAYAENGHKALLAHLFDLLYTHLQSDDTVTTEVTLTLSKNDNGDWTFDKTGNVAFYNALYGGSNVLEGLASALS
ncbi:hypothetical protein [Paratractidigestivibacter sp.]|uniref:hypothetical protein n=1 Tax=Paratractidigestivibacter sp. TaxID=2847316 RepID=UPI002AC8E3FE|nr:hypothetical protein [Paratractidigestivibacter sp.]